MNDYFYSLEMLLRRHFEDLDDRHYGRYPVPLWLQASPSRAQENNQ